MKYRQTHGAHFHVLFKHMHASYTLIHLIHWFGKNNLHIVSHHDANEQVGKLALQRKSGSRQEILQVKVDVMYIQQ